MGRAHPLDRFLHPRERRFLILALLPGLGFGVWGLGVVGCGLGVGVWGLVVGGWGLGFGVWGLGVGVWGVRVKGCEG